jgi:hypothetical protein
MRYPEMLLPLLLNKVSELRSVGRASIDRRDVNVITYPDAAGRTYTLSFDAQTGLLVRLAWLVDEIQFSASTVGSVRSAISEHERARRLKRPDD